MYFVVSRIFPAPRYSKPQNLRLCYPVWPKALGRCDKVEDLEIILDCLGCLMSSHGSLRVRGREEGQSQRRWDDGSRGQSEDVSACKVEGVHEPGMQVAPRNWKRQGGEFPLEPPEGREPCRHLDFSPVRPSFDF